MSKKSHARAPDKTGFSVALPTILVGQIERIAAEEHRTRNGQIVHFLTEAAARYRAAHPEIEKKPSLYAMPEPDLEQDIAAEVDEPPQPAAQSQSQSQSFPPYENKK